MQEIVGQEIVRQELVIIAYCMPAKLMKIKLLTVNRCWQRETAFFYILGRTKCSHLHLQLKYRQECTSTGHSSKLVQVKSLQPFWSTQGQ